MNPSVIHAIVQLLEQRARQQPPGPQGLPPAPLTPQPFGGQVQGVDGTPRIPSFSQGQTPPPNLPDWVIGTRG